MEGEAPATNVRPGELNYDSYETQQYDADIEAVIPFHREIHEHIRQFLAEKLDPAKPYHILELGAGTGITTQDLRAAAPLAQIDVVDFSETMLNGARAKFVGDERLKFIQGDYAELDFSPTYDLVASVIGIHHQNGPAAKRALFQKIFDCLKPGGSFVFGDLVTHRDSETAKVNTEAHEGHMIVQAGHNPQRLAEWMHHHRELNDLAPIEDQIEWLQQAGFVVRQDFLALNTALLLCQKPPAEEKLVVTTAEPTPEA